MKNLHVKIRLLFLFSMLLNVSCVAQRGASHYDKERMCWGEHDTFTDFGPSGCDSAATIAVDSDGEYWRFSDTCLPGGFEPLKDPELNYELLMSPGCATLDQREDAQ